MDLCILASVPQQSVTNTNTPIDSLTKYMYVCPKKKLKIQGTIKDYWLWAFDENEKK